MIEDPAAETTVEPREITSREDWDLTPAEDKVTILKRGSGATAKYPTIQVTGSYADGVHNLTLPGAQEFIMGMRRHLERYTEFSLPKGYVKVDQPEYYYSVFHLPTGEILGGCVTATQYAGASRRDSWPQYPTVEAAHAAGIDTEVVWGEAKGFFDANGSPLKCDRVIRLIEH